MSDIKDVISNSINSGNLHQILSELDCGVGRLGSVYFVHRDPTIQGSLTLDEIIHAAQGVMVKYLITDSKDKHLYQDAQSSMSRIQVLKNNAESKLAHCNCTQKLGRITRSIFGYRDYDKYDLMTLEKVVTESEPKLS